MREAVRYAAARVPVAIVSGAFRAEIEPVVEAAGLATSSRRSSQPTTSSTASRIPRAICARSSGSGSTAPEAVAFEDTEAGVAAAKAAGLRCIAVRGTLPDDRLALADEIVDRIDVALVRRLIGSA